MRVGNVNLLLLFLVALGAWLLAGREPRRQLAAGTALAVAIAWKPLLAFVPVFTLAGVWRDEVSTTKTDHAASPRRIWSAPVAQLAGLVLGATAAWIVGALYLGSAGAWRAWLGVLGRLTPSWTIDAGNVSPARLIFGHVTWWLPPLALLAAVVVAFGIRNRAVARVREATRRGLASVRRCGLGIVLFLLISPLVWLHYLVLALPLSIALLAGARARRSIGCAGTVVVALALVGYIPYDNGVGSGTLAAWLAAAGLTLLLALGIREELQPADGL